MERNDGLQADVFLKNLGGTGEFTIRYQLVRLGDDLERERELSNNATNYVETWNAPEKLVSLDTGEVFSDTVEIPDNISLDRYLLETHAVKKQEYVIFEESSRGLE